MHTNIKSLQIPLRDMIGQQKGEKFITFEKHFSIINLIAIQSENYDFRYLPNSTGVPF